METNKTGKYLKYAIGEIILVMISILLALQVSEWNTQRKSQKEERFILTKLRSNLEQDISLLDSCKATNKFFMEQLDTLLVVLQKPEGVKREGVANKFKYVRNFRRFEPVKVTYDNIIASGKIGIIKNQNLVDHLFLYYREVESVANSMGASIADYSRKTIVPYFMEFDFWDDHKLNVDASFIDERDYKFTIEKKPLTAYAKDPFILNSLLIKVGMLERLNANYSRINDESQKLIDLIDVELDSKTNND